MAGAPSLGVNFATNPFQVRRQEAMPQSRRMDGFSDDGLSYAVIDDWDKLASQALAQYEARLAKPRTDIWGRTLAEDTPAALDAELFQPLRLLFGSQGGVTTQRPQAFETEVGVIERDPFTGSWNNRFPLPAKADDSQNKALALRVKELQSRRRDLLSGMIPSKENQAEAAKISLQIDDLLGGVSGLSRTNAPAAFVPQTNAVRRLKYNPSTGKLE